MGLYSITTRADGTVLTGFGSTSDIFNADHENHVTHTEPESLNSWEENVTQMDLETDPDPAGVISLADSLGDEFERLRFTLSTLKAAISAGTAPAHWYTHIDTFSFYEALPAIACRRTTPLTTTIQTSLETSIAWTATTYTNPATMDDVQTGILPPVTGIYAIGGCWSFGNAVNTGPLGVFRIALNVNGARVAAQQSTFSTGAPRALTVETIATATLNVPIILTVFQSSGSNQSPSITPVPAALWAVLLAR